MVRRITLLLGCPRLAPDLWHIAEAGVEAALWLHLSQKMHAFYSVVSADIISQKRLHF